MNFVLGYTEKSFSRDVIRRWGSLSDELAYNENLLHPQMAALARLCKSDQSECVSVLTFLEETLARRDVILEIENAIAISFLDWPDLSVLGAEVAPTVSAVVRTQWGLR